MKRIKAKGITLIVYEPAMPDNNFFKSEVFKGLASFKSASDLVITNRLTEDLAEVTEKVFTRDLFYEN